MTYKHNNKYLYSTTELMYTHKRKPSYLLMMYTINGQSVAAQSTSLHN